MSEKENTNYINWERVRGTRAYNEAMVNILLGLLKQTDLFDADGAAAAFVEVENMDEFRLFCKKWDKEGKINPDEAIAAAEKIYARNPEPAIEVTDRDKKIMKKFLMEQGSSEESIDRLSDEFAKKQKKNKPKVQ
ncbi:MAG: hypothetical protein HY918_01965 [Candidatus Doudnabacteria bacterium]|nr:hypothetical protein [Candidatus Doudnabacteria bacterium]